jgi:hypothetical protein
MSGPNEPTPPRTKSGSLAGAPAREPDDARILAGLRALFEGADPVPAELRERVRFAYDVAHDLAGDGTGVDGELATLCARYGVVGAVRGGARQPAQTLTFESSQLTICVTIGHPGGGAARLDGWLDPAVSMRVELAAGGIRLYAMSDEGGRFVFDGVRTGDARLAVHPTPGCPVQLARTVHTPSFEL